MFFPLILIEIDFIRSNPIKTNIFKPPKIMIFFLYQETLMFTLPFHKEYIMVQNGRCSYCCHTALPVQSHAHDTRFSITVYSGLAIR